MSYGKPKRDIPSLRLADLEAMADDEIRGMWIITNDDGTESRIPIERPVTQE